MIGHFFLPVLAFSLSLSFSLCALNVFKRAFRDKRDCESRFVSFHSDCRLCVACLRVCIERERETEREWRFVFYRSECGVCVPRPSRAQRVADGSWSESYIVHAQSNLPVHIQQHSHSITCLSHFLSMPYLHPSAERASERERARERLSLLGTCL